VGIHWELGRSPWNEGRGEGVSAKEADHEEGTGQDYGEQPDS